MTKVGDIVCGAEIEEDGSETFVKTYGPERYFFCSPNCLLLFSYDPLYYIRLRVEAGTAKGLGQGKESASNSKNAKEES